MSRLFLLCLLLFDVPLSGAPSYTVLVGTPRYPVFVGDIRSVCGPSTLACTEIVSVSLTEQCRETHGGWQPAAMVMFTPVVHLPAYAPPGYSRKLLLHEFEHVRDFYRSAEAYARALAQRRFDTVEDCSVATIKEEAAFDRWLAGVGRRSVALRR